MLNSKSLLGVNPKKLVIGGLSVSSIKSAMNGESFKIQGLRPVNAFCIKADGHYYIYVRTTYTLYRKAMRLMCDRILNTHDIDHVLAKKLAATLGIRYVLLSIVERSVNRSHGSIEKLAVIKTGIYLNKVYFMDDRIYNKIFSEKKENLSSSYQQYNPAIGKSNKLEFRYGHKYNSALGFDRLRSDFIDLLSPYTPHVKV